MEALFLYFGKIIFSSGVMFLYYKLFLKDKTFHHYNRFYLLAAVVISLLLPLLKVSYFTLEVNNSIYLLINKLQILSSSNNADNDFNYFKTGAFFTGLVAVFFLTKLIFGLVKIQILKKKYNKENFEGISFYQTDLAEAPFSFFKNLFWKNSIEIQSDLGRQILKHEMVHIEQKHSWDKIFLEITTSLFWFNPFFYLIKKEISLLHEYLADKKALKNSDTKAFAQMLLASHFSGKQLPATSPFLNSNLKKRLTMLKKSKTKFSYARRILSLPLLFILSFIYLVNAKNKEIKMTNLEIEKTIRKLKLDTIKPNNSTSNFSQKDIPVGTDASKVDEEQPDFFYDQDSVTAHHISNSPEFNRRMKEAEKRAAEADKIVNSPAFKKRIEEAEKKAVDAEKLVNSPAFKKRIEEAEKKAADADKLVNSPAFKKRIEEAEKKAADADKLVNSPAFKKRIEEAEKKAAEVAKLVASPLFKMKYNGKKSGNLEIQGSDAKNKLNDHEHPDIFIDDKPASNEEMQRLNPATIESMHVFKKGFEGKKNGEIHIKLKK